MTGVHVMVPYMTGVRVMVPYMTGVRVMVPYMTGVRVMVPYMTGVRVMVPYMTGVRVMVPYMTSVRVMVPYMTGVRVMVPYMTGVRVMVRNMLLHCVFVMQYTIIYIHTNKLWLYFKQFSHTHTHTPHATPHTHATSHTHTLHHTPHTHATSHTHTHTHTHTSLYFPRSCNVCTKRSSLHLPVDLRSYVEHRSSNMQGGQYVKASNACSLCSWDNGFCSKRFAINNEHISIHFSRKNCSRGHIYF